jgi:ubiquinone/menaquinone biosynthesis C-methylase UbiE
MDSDVPRMPDPPGAEHLDFPDASFDDIYCARLFHFFTGDRIRIGMSKFSRWLRPVGRLDGREIAGAIGRKA